MKRAKISRPDATGRDSKRLGSDGAVIILRRSFWLSPQVSALSPTARALLVELTSMYKGPSYNGRIFLSVRDGARRLGLNCTKASSAAIDELLGSGLLTETLAGSFSMKAGIASRARAFRLNWKTEAGSPVGKDDLVPLDFARLSKKARWRVEERSIALQAYQKQSLSVGESPTMMDCRADWAAGIVGESPTLQSRNGENPPSRIVGEFPTHIYYQGGRGPMPSDIMISMRDETSPPPFIRSPMGGGRLFCQLIALRRSINQPLKKSGPRDFRCEQCGDSLIGGRSGRRFCTETCRKRAEGRRRYDRMKVAA